MNRIEQQSDNITSGINDLAVTNDQQSQIKGGPSPKNKRTLVLQSSATDQDSALGDLEPNGDVKGGPSGWGNGGVLINHNETAAEDDEEAEALDDLSAPVNALPDLEPENEVVGGALKGKPMHLVNCGDGASGGSTLSNHNETAAADDEEEAEELSDLPVVDEQATQAQGGAVRVGKLLGVNY